MPRVSRLAAALGCTLVLLAGCSEKQAAAPPPPPTPIAKLNTASMAIGRVPFCDLIGKDAVKDALGGKATSRAKWRNGDIVGVGPEEKEPEQKDVVHEFGCSFTRGSNLAEAWIFARPVTPTLAGRIVALKQPGCTSAPQPPFGSPSLNQVCRLADGTFRGRHAGLFEQTWLTCQVTAPGTGPTPKADVVKRADAWCVRVANAVNARD